MGKAPCIPTGTLPDHVLVAPNHKIFQKVWDNWAPRVGLAYRLGQNTVLRAGIGRYYDTWGNVDAAVAHVIAIGPAASGAGALARRFERGGERIERRPQPRAGRAEERDGRGAERRSDVHQA